VGARPGAHRRGDQADGAAGPLLPLRRV